MRWPLRSSHSHLAWRDPCPPTTNPPPTGDDIVDAARNTGDGLTYKLYGHSNETPSGQPKDAHFVGDTLDKVGLGFGDKLSDRPTIADWADPRSNIPGWHAVGDGSIQPGDVLATAKPIPLSSYHGGGQQLGVATGDGTSIGIVDNDRVGENDFGHQDGHNPTTWRSTNLAAASSPDDGDYNDGIRDGSGAAGGLLGEAIGKRFGGPIGQIVGGVAGAVGGGWLGTKKQAGKIKMPPNPKVISGPVPGIAPGYPGSPGDTD